MTNYDLVTSISLFMIGISYYFFPNQKLNSSFAYRSSYAKKSEAVWCYAQKMVPPICMIGSFILICVINTFYEFNFGWSVEIKEIILKILPLAYD